MTKAQTFSKRILELKRIIEKRKNETGFDIYASNICSLKKSVHSLANLMLLNNEIDDTTPFIKACGFKV
jgi:hypothetical protein